MNTGALGFEARKWGTEGNEGNEEGEKGWEVP